MSVIKLCWTEDADQSFPLPTYKTLGAAGADVCANFTYYPSWGPDRSYRSVSIEPGARALISTGLLIAVPEGFEVQVRPRSGIAWNWGVTLLNSPGTIDSDYRGEIKVNMINHGDETIKVTHGMRIAQLVMSPVVQASFEVVDSLDNTERGSSGFGSTGVS